MSTLLPAIEVLVSCAGLARGWKKFYEATEEEWNQVIDTNVKGLLFVIRQVVPYMQKRGRGHVINIGSTAGRWVYPNDAVYCASKFAVRSITETLRMDLFGHDIKVTLIEPGPVKTEIAEVRHRSAAIAARAWAGYQPLLPEDVADVVAWAAQQPSHVNIQEIVLFPTDQAGMFMLKRSPR
jgi:NADP-dependent 3-hydroxy acid dehydrogenase YdfG